MKLAILKFGGSSLSNSKRIIYIALRIKQYLEFYDRIVVVLSAPANITDELSLIHKAVSSLNPPASLLQIGELISISLMESAVREKNVSAKALNHYEISIIAEGNESDAKLISINEKRLKNELRRYRVLILPGFIAHTRKMKPVTLGRGGSDYTAVFLSDILSSPCYLYSDIKGIYSSNPLQIADALKLEKVSYSELSRMIECGVQIRQIKAVNFALRKKIKLYLGSSFLSDEKPTEISKDTSDKRIKFISRHEIEKTTLFFVANKIESRDQIIKEIKASFPQSSIKLKKDILILKNQNPVSDKRFSETHRRFILK
ncbi:MAG: hypothetical protein ACP5PA_04845 [Elusimicrobiales bacterium]